MKLRQRKGIWVLNWTDENGTRRRVSTGSRDKAAAHEEASRIMAGKSERGAPNFRTVGAELDRLWNRRWKQQRAARSRWYEVKTVDKKWGDVPLASITYNAVEGWQDDLMDDGLKPATINKFTSILSVALQEAAHSGQIPTMVRLPRLPTGRGRIRWITDAEEQLLLSETPSLDQDRTRSQGGGAVKYPETGEVMANLTIALLRTGCRLSELLKAEPSDLTEGLRGWSLTIPESKSGNPRGVPLTKDGEAAMTFLLGHPTWQAVTSGTNENLTRLASARDWCIKRFTIMRDRARLPDVSLHILRHTAASRMVQAGVPLYEVQTILGHSNPATTQNYAHLNTEHLRAAIENLARSPKDPPAKLRLVR